MKAKTNYRTPSQFRIALGLTKYALKANFRNKTSYFFSLVFPLVFVAVFGYLGNSQQTISIGVPNTFDTTNPVYTSLQAIASKTDSPLVIVSGTESDLEKQLSQSKIAAIIDPPNDTPPTITGQPAHLFTLVSSNANPQGKAEAQSFLSGVMSQINLQALGVHTVPFDYSQYEVSGKEYRYIDFALPGQIGFSLLQLATFGIAFPLITLRKTLVLKRMFASTVRPITFVVSQCLSRSFQAMLQALVILAVGVYGFHFTLAHGAISVINILILAFIGVLAFLGFGILIGNIARDEQSLPIAINLFNLPQILLAGVFFPVDGMPKALQFIGNNLPLAYLNTALRKVAFEGQSLASVWTYIAGMIIWGIVAYILAAQVFKSE